ncbi:MAG: hypothetical protein DRJ56_06580 [Thermoprotei archaeon]|mgnify:CR=1 FL=1|nr:MAG: hypothetical protein DRJ56_06580 [Thermoprotei archaeon]
MIKRLRERRFRNLCFELAASSKHIVVLGPTRSGKTTFVRNMARVLRRCCDFVILDMYGEYGGVVRPSVRPRIPFGPWLRNLAMVLRPASGGVEMTRAVYRALRRAKGWADFLAELERMTVDWELRRGASAVLSRVEPLHYAGVLVDAEAAIPQSCTVDFSQLNEEEKAYAMLMTLTWLFGGMRKWPRRRFIVVEEFRATLLGDQVTPVVAPMLDRVARTNHRLVIVTQSLPPNRDIRDTLLQQNIVVFHPGDVLAWQYYLNGFHRDVMSLKGHEALVYMADQRKWKKLKVPETLD